MLYDVAIKLIAPNNDEIVVKCNAKIAKSTLGPEWAWIDDNGGYHFFYKEYITILIGLFLKLNIFSISS